jgi:hypothetical protein
MTSCNQIMAELTALRADIAALDNKYLLKTEKPQIVQQSIAGADALIMPKTEQLIAIAIASLAIKFGVIEALAKTALAAAATAAQVAAAAAAKVATLALAVAGVVASIAALKVLGARIDAVELGLNFLGNDVSRLFGQLLGIKNTANRADSKADTALSKANAADNIANQANSKATRADQVAEDARAIANRADSKADTAISTANKAESIARQAYDGAKQAINTANGAQTTADSADATANRAIGVANNATTIGNNALSTARSAQTTADSADATANRAIGVANNATTIGNNALSTARSAQTTADKALAVARSIPAGKQGERGERGERGLQGIQGVPGIRGIQGIQGVPGIRGERGEKGESAEVDAATKRLIQQIAQNAAFIPALVARPAALSFSQTASAAASGTCQTTRPGGCMSNLAKNTANDINNKTQQGLNNLSNLLNGLGIGDLIKRVTAMQGVLGNQLRDKFGNPIGLTNFTRNFTKWSVIDRVTNLLILGSTLHNAAMLSNDLFVTLIQSINNVLATFGLKDSEDNEIDIAVIIKGQISDLLKKVLGLENYVKLTLAWKKANRIYQTGANVVSRVRSIVDSVGNIATVTNVNVADIGNALRRDGAVKEDSYNAMSRTVGASKFQKAVDRLASLSEAASDIESITSSVRSVKEDVEAIRGEQAEFKKAITEGIKTQEKLEKEIDTSTNPPNIEEKDLVRGE